MSTSRAWPSFICLSRRPSAYAYEDGHIEIDNNAAERSLRGVALGRKNYLFAGSDRGSDRAAAIYGLIGSPDACFLSRSSNHCCNPRRSLSHAYAPLVKKSRALYWSADKALRAVVTISKHYLEGEGGYWYAYHSDWDKFLSEATQGLYVLGCIGRDEAYALPYRWIHSRIKYLSVTEREEKSHWHILLYPTPSGELALRLNNGQTESLDDFQIALGHPSVASSAI